ncbi:MAG: alanine--tRNA ligase [Anaerolineae bacterium]|nr:alanine--tRNA ligase [Anaerolineae bacterium]
MISSAEIRSKFLHFFEQHGHTIVPSSSLVPANDPTLLFTNAGMVQFKDVFLGLERRPYKRATSSQKCMRVSGKHNDLESVGPSPRHHTFFEMLGNFSFGDYFKAEAIEFAWTFLTKELGLPPERLYATIYKEDDDAFALWQKIAQLPPERIVRLGKKDNFWEMGDTGPCGPCSEIIYDRGPEACTCGDPNCNPANECDRWLELWNLVFMQFERREDGSTVPLPRPSIDTGMGLERITSVLQGVDNNYDTDLFLPIMQRTRELLGHDEETMRANIVPYRVIADHSRAITFLIADGVLPGNEGRNYVLRLILRRAARFGRLLGFEGPFLAQTAQAVIETMGHHYSELEERRDFICQAITQEEERFLTTLSVGLGRLEELIAQLKSQGRDTIPGDEAFRLYDTYGFPLELTRDAATEAGMTVDEEGFRKAMAEQRERARSAQRFTVDALGEFYRQLKLPKTIFVGYEKFSSQAQVLAIVKGKDLCQKAHAGEEVEIILDTTPFYAESGGQVGDTGELRSEKVRVSVQDTVKPIPDLFVHRCLIQEGELCIGDQVEAIVNKERRLDIARNHTATHLLHRALRQVLGEHAAQAGSLVAPDRLRFDFSHLAPLSKEELRQVENIVNAQIRANRPVHTQIMPFEEARRSGAIALFGEKYGDQVRVVTIEGFTAELCGGTHLRATGEIGFFLIVSESSVGAGLRRIEAVTGRGAETYVRARLDTLEELQGLLPARPGEELQRTKALLEQVREQRRLIQELQRELASQHSEALLEKTVEVKGIPVLAARVEANDVDTLRQMCDRLRDKLGSAVVALGATINGRPLLVVSLTKDLIGRGLHAGKLAGAAAKHMGGGGGGRPNMAQAGGKEASKLQEALAAIPELVSQSLQS